MAKLELQAMAVELPSTPGHPNKRPFSGILTRIDEPSDGAPGGSGGLRVVVTRAAAEAALGTLIGMGVDMRKTADGHDPQRKVGVITTATIEGNALMISGFLYERDFPDEMELIDKDKHLLGFSFELTPTEASILDGFYVVGAGDFTGAAILYKDKAAYHSTRLAAAATENEMTPEEITALITTAVKEAVTPLQAKLDAYATQVDTHLIANKAVIDKIEPHASACEACAAAMEAEGVGVHGQFGHAVKLRKMAGAMRADAAVGKVPHIWRDHDYPVDAALENKDDEEMTPEDRKLLTDLAASVATGNEANVALKAQLADLTTQLTDLKAAKRDVATPPERKTTTTNMQVAVRHGVQALDETGKVKTGAALEAALRDANVTDPVQRMAIKRSLEREEMGL